MSEKKQKGTSFRKAYNEYYPLVFSMIYSRTGSREDAEDIAQEVFIRLHKNFSEVREVRNWLFTALRFEITNYYSRKANSRKETVDIDTLRDTAIISSEDDTREVQIIIADILGDRSNYDSEQEMLLFELVAIYSFSFKDVASFLGLTRWQVEYRFKKTEMKILHKLREKGILEAGDIL